MLNLRVNARGARLMAAHCRCLATQSQLQPTKDAADSEFTEKPEYPAIQELSFRARKEREKIDWHEQIRRVPTVEEKLIKINMPRYYGHKVVQLGDAVLPYNCLPALQHYTRTAFEPMATLEPPTTKEDAQLESTTQLDAFTRVISGNILETLEFANDVFRHKYPDPNVLDPKQREEAFTQMVVEQINRVLLVQLAADHAHLREVEIDYNPRHEAFWAVGGIQPPRNVVKSKKGREWQKEMANDPVDRLMQYNGSPYLALRHRNQLPTWKSASESENAERAKLLPRFNYDPRTLGYLTDYKHGTNIPGYWPGSSGGFGYLSYQSRSQLLNRPKTYDAEDYQDALHAQAIQTSYAWLLAQANYNGFNTYNELTYPMNTQTIVTNGRLWSFYEYQLNTLLVHTHHVDKNARLNFCRGTVELPLYEEFDADGKCIGFNEQTLRQLMRFYMNAPCVRRNSAELQPNLHSEHKHIADYDNEEQRSFLEQTFKHMSANRPRHLATPEIYLWEKIYKIDNKTRQMEAKRRFFELGINPWRRTMDQHQKEYIPRCVRADGPKSKNKWKPTFYP